MRDLSLTCLLKKGNQDPNFLNKNKIGTLIRKDKSLNYVTSIFNLNFTNTGHNVINMNVNSCIDKKFVHLTLLVVVLKYTGVLKFWKIYQKLVCFTSIVYGIVI